MRAQLAAVGIGELSISPMAARPDTTARLACEDRGIPAILAACKDRAGILDTLTADLCYGVADHWNPLN